MVFSLMFLVSTLCVGGWSHTIDWNVPEAEAVKAGDNFDWQLGGPVQFIEHLKAERHNKQRATYPIGGCHVGCGRPETTGPTRVVAFLHEPYDLQERWASVLLLLQGRIEASRPCSG